MASAMHHLRGGAGVVTGPTASPNEASFKTLSIR